MDFSACFCECGLSKAVQCNRTFVSLKAMTLLLFSAAPPTGALRESSTSLSAGFLYTETHVKRFWQWDDPGLFFCFQRSASHKWINVRKKSTSQKIRQRSRFELHFTRRVIAFFHVFFWHYTIFQINSTQDTAYYYYRQWVTSGRDSSRYKTYIKIRAVSSHMSKDSKFL